jgi:hypothetical protein
VEEVGSAVFAGSLGSLASSTYCGLRLIRDWRRGSTVWTRLAAHGTSPPSSSADRACMLITDLARVVLDRPQLYALLVFYAHSAEGKRGTLRDAAEESE